MTDTGWLYRVPTDCELQRICDSLPSEGNPLRRQILPDILRDWREHHLEGNFLRIDLGIAEQKEVFEKIARCVSTSLVALEELSSAGRIGLAQAVGSARQHSLLGGPDADDYFNETHAVLRELKAAASAAQKTKSFGKEAVIEFEVIQDLGEIYTWATGMPPRRAPNNKGRFRRFAWPIWELIFGGDEKSATTLNTAIRKLVDLRTAATREAQAVTQKSPNTRLELPEVNPSLLSEAAAEAEEQSSPHWGLPSRVILYV